jgi:carboxynorspermidine decarboxylase
MNIKDIQKLSKIETPAYVVDTRLLEKNLKLLREVQDKAGCKILLALKGFSMHNTFPLVGKYLEGVTSSSLFEARLGHEYMGKEVHIYAPAYKDSEIDEIMSYCGHIVFNSVSQFHKFRNKAFALGIECGIRINPEYSEVETEIYDPCATNSRLGTTLQNLEGADLDGLSGLHFHTMCEQNSDTLERTLKVVEEKFSHFFDKIKWINFGGGHHITKPNYDVEKLINVIKKFKEKYDLEVYLEPGEAVALNTGYLVAEVLDIVKNNMDIAILDTSAACHMPDVLEMPYRPEIENGFLPSEKEYTFRLAGHTCLAGDVIGDYSFEKPLKIGDKLIFKDMAHYSMVKNNTFNGVNLPSIMVMDENDITLVKSFNFDDYKSRLS